MTLRLTDFERIANQIAREEDPALEVIAVMDTAAAKDYTEVILAYHSGPVDSFPTRLIIGTSRKLPETAVRRLLRDQVRDYLRKNRAVKA